MKRLIITLIALTPCFATAQTDDRERVAGIIELDERIAGIIKASINKNTKFNEVDVPVQNNQQMNQPIKLNEAVGAWNTPVLQTEFDKKTTVIDKKRYLETFTIKQMVDELICLLGIEDTSLPKEKVEFYLDNIRYYQTIFQVHERLRIAVKDNDKLKLEDRKVYIKKVLENMDLIKYQYEFLLDREYTLYRNTNLSNKLIKGINIYHDNDFLFIKPLSVLNNDRDYTGGIRIEVTTDQLKMRFLSEIFEDSKFFNNSNVLTYQSLFFGVEAYTPYIRFGQEEATLRDSVYYVDRPFASFQYFGRTRYRLHYTGKWRLRNEMKIGWIGKDLGKKGQDVLHRDITIASTHVEKWDNQIGDGGRLAINFDYYGDLMLYSVDGDMFKPNRQYSVTEYKKHKRRSLHFYAPFEVHAGNQYTGLGGGLGLSNISFKDRSGGYDFNIPPGRRADKGSQFGRWLQRSISLSVETKLKHVIHNSMLQGVGWFTTKESDSDGSDDEYKSVRKLMGYEYKEGDKPEDNYNVKDGKINRWIFNTDFSVSLKQKKTTIFLTYSFNTKEYRYAEADIQKVVKFANSPSTIPGKTHLTWNQVRQDNISEKKYAQDIITTKLFDQKIRGYGRVGLNFQL
ncbi:DUF2219 family protein [Emticicia sp. CRIBPO]|uniref:lipid A-modifier LpxR family protein n=1 Tax=Emticicia sp. CRIBPO TaxID=2683258 RepID=UPI001413085B|nr:lipid A-modifier LpxR family protein [Emticicia sp. CRIBPO]NBA87704.1 DUF2219 family protein [Emticicia sp. CRIBPO]